jgi:hypothetical protein
MIIKEQESVIKIEDSLSESLFRYEDLTRKFGNASDQLK